MVSFIVELVTDYVFLSAFSAWFLAQVGKTVRLTVKEKSFRWSLLMRRASMPSSHSSTVTGLTTALFISQGVTALSVTSLVFSLVVLRDAMDINMGIPKKERIMGSLRTYIHKPLEVAVGILLGIVVAVVLYLVL